MESVPARDPGARSLVGRMGQANCTADARPEHSWTGENPGRGAATGQPASRRVRAEVGEGRQEPDPEAPCQGLGSVLRAVGLLESFTRE